MALFAAVFVPMSMSPGIVEMFRQTKRFEASNLREAKRLVEMACPGGLDPSGEWSVESVTLYEALKAKGA